MGPYLNNEVHRIFESYLILEILFQDVLSALAVCTNGCGFPATVIPTWVALV